MIREHGQKIPEEHKNPGKSSKGDVDELYKARNMTKANLF